MGGDDVSRGRVEYCYNGTWHSLCADGWDTMGEEVNWVCEQAGFDTNDFGKVNLHRLIVFWCICPTCRVCST